MRSVAGGARGHRLRRAGVMVLLALLLGSCGITDQDEPEVIERGEVPFEMLGSTSTTSTTAGTTANAYTVFLVDDGRLVAVERRSPEPVGTGAVVEGLLGGPTASESAAGLTTAVPSGARIRPVVASRGVLTVALGGGFPGSASEASLALGQLVLSLTAVPGVEAVRFRSAGAAVEVPKGDGTLSDGPVSAADYAGLLA